MQYRQPLLALRGLSTHTDTHAHAHTHARTHTHAHAHAHTCTHTREGKKIQEAHLRNFKVKMSSWRENNIKIST